MATKFKTASIGNFVERVDVWDPRAATQGTEFDYVDIASIDREKKEITAPTRMVASEAPSRARQLIKHRDVLVSTVRPNLNAVAWVPRDLDGATASTGFSVVRCNGSGLHDRYLFHWVRTRQFVGDMVRQSTGASYPAVSDRIVRESKIPLPQPDDPKRSLAEQKRIAAILDKADAIRRRRHEAAQLTDQLIPAIFYEMFSKWLRMPQAEMAQLGDEALADIVSGVTKGRRFGDQVTVVVPYIRVANVQDGYLDLSEIKEIEVLPQDVEALRLEHGDVLMTEGGDFDKLGRGGIWEHDIPDCIHQNHVFRVRCNREKLLPLFFAFYIRTHLVKGYFLRCAKKTSNLATINKTQLRALPVPRVPIDAQKRFVAEANDVRSMQRRDERAIRETDDLFNSLAQSAFRGEL